MRKKCEKSVFEHNARTRAARTPSTECLSFYKRKRAIALVYANIPTSLKERWCIVQKCTMYYVHVCDVRVLQRDEDVHT